MPREAPLRLFVACPLPEDVKRGLAAIQDDLRAGGAPRLRYVRPEGIHITLKFLGSVQAERIESITASLECAIEPFELQLAIDRLGGFGGARIRVVWAGLSGDTGSLVALAGRVESALGPLGFPPEKRPFAPHITLARVPDEASSEDRRRLSTLVQVYKIRLLPPIIVSDVLLISSILGPGGSKYERLASFPADRGKNA